MLRKTLKKALRACLLWMMAVCLVGSGQQAQAWAAEQSAVQQQMWLSKLQSQRSRAKKPLPVFVRTRGGTVAQFKSLVSSVDGQLLLLSETVQGADKYKRLWLYNNHTQVTTLSVHENPRDFYATLELLTAKHGLSITLGTERISGTYHVMTRLPLRVLTTAVPVHAGSDARRQPYAEAAGGFYKLSLQLVARQRRYQAAVLHFAAPLSQAPQLTRIVYAPESYVLAMIVTTRRYRGTELHVQEQVVFCDARRLILDNSLEVTAANEYAPTAKQQHRIFQKQLLLSPYIAAQLMTFQLLSGTVIELVVDAASLAAAQTVQTRQELQALMQ